MESTQVLDCTLRDGGYYNNWDFSEELIRDYLSSVCNAKIDMIELGLRSFPSTSFKGAHAFTTEKYINELDLPEGPSYGVMVDAKTIISSELGIQLAVEKLFSLKNDSKLTFVRVAAHYHEISDAVTICCQLKELGYFVGLNLMQSAGKPSEQITEASKQANECNCIDVLYFADSLGNMDLDEASRIISAMKAGWPGKLGIHGHDNTARALSNTLHALDDGVTFLDSTITGMGRGAGNTKTEILLFELEHSRNLRYNSVALHELVLKHFEPMQRHYGWGTSLLYHIGAVKNVHPSYIQQLYSDNRFAATERAAAISYLGSIESSSYDGSNLEKALNISKVFSSSPDSRGENISNLFEGKKVLLIGAGESVKKYSKAVIQYIEETNPIVICVNINDSIPSELINYFAASHNIKYLSDHDKYKGISEKLIAPKSRFNGFVHIAKNYELVINNNWQVESDRCELPYENTAAYSLSIAIAGGAKSIELVGFDGYPHLDERNKEVQEIFEYFKNLIKIICLTPTNYSIATGSIYAL